ncbi:hypothetical protein LX15_001414 [Streptoalloteichus tenebrarius]|uniref:Uncharacterized protein n=1 Tax=Streptoalloteichus tenebrarius (strain ATCC 17920 / DSM 40477 / JCM 4838 / CBS 697.72 / NBRC 16177 / NCIMB 11028 / NRRL B-12390 / A12253. 1 / ISP 5477) TaxID=1933 RepID=A0ABT1HQF0_STRSD|nr:hypothetical protein [Streptoalloteichus tenebrarius]MCP2257728.1 hypothetical protein [Streptoalloteichus tenebrarius]BFE99918.1 hypothetical protein GCM10020241_15940 [Streptoalloteichus tenebrarius]
MDARVARIARVDNRRGEDPRPWPEVMRHALERQVRDDGHFVVVAFPPRVPQEAGRAGREPERMTALRDELTQRCAGIGYVVDVELPAQRQAHAEEGRRLFGCPVEVLSPDEDWAAWAEDQLARHLSGDRTG